METINLNSNEGNTFSIRKGVWLGVFVLLVAVVASFYFFTYEKKLSGNSKEMATTTAVDVFQEVRQGTKTKGAYEQLTFGNYKEAYKQFSELQADPEIKQDAELLGTLKLFRTSALLTYDREAAFKEYYEFGKDENNSLRNRAYALLMAQQNTVANNDPKKILFFLSEAEVRDIKVLDNKNIQYAISKKIFNLWPFPITAARLALFEVEQLDKKNPNSKQKAEAIRKKYMFRFEENISLMEQKEGLRHLIANSLSARANLNSLLEDLGVTSAIDTSTMYEEAIQKATLYSPKGTKHFLMVGYLEHEVKVNNEEKVDKILMALTEERKVGIFGNVVTIFTKSDMMKELYPNIFARYSKDGVFKNKMVQVFGPSK